MICFPIPYVPVVKLHGNVFSYWNIVCHLYSSFSLVSNHLVEKLVEIVISIFFNFFFPANLCISDLG